MKNVPNKATSPENKLNQQLAQLRQQLASQSVELRQAREEIQRLKSRHATTGTIDMQVLWQAIEQSSSSIVITDHTGNIVYVNPYFTQLTGYTLNEVLGENPNILKSGFTPREEYEELWQAIRSGREWSGRFQNKKKDGSYYWENARIAPVMDSDGTITHFIAIKDDITEARQTEQALRESENRFRTLVSSMDDIVFTLDRDQRHTGVYGRWLEAHQVTPSYFLGKTSREMMGDDAATPHEVANQRALNGENVVYEWAINDQVVQTSLSPLRNDEGKITGIVGIGRDISQLKQSEQRLRESERFAHAVVDALAAHIAILDESGTIVAVNQAWNKFAEESNTDPRTVGPGISYLNVMRAVDPTSEDASVAQEVLSGLEALINGERSSFILEYPCHSPETQSWYSLQCSRFEQKGAARIVVAHENITERVLAQQMLTDNNARLENLVHQRTRQLEQLNRRIISILNNVSVPMLLIEASGQVEITNPAFNHKMGCEQDALFGQLFWNIFAPEEQAGIEATFRGMTPASIPAPLQAHLVTHNGSIIDVELALGIIPGNESNIVCTVYDISHLKELERIKDEFISLVNHELRTPISAIMLSASTLDKYYDRYPETRIREKITQMNQQAENLSELVNAILDIARIGSRQGNPGAHPVDTAQALHDVIAEIAPQAQSRHQTLDAQVVNSSLTIQGEYMDLVRVWRNLLNNAIKYTPEGGHIQVRLYGASGDDTSHLPDLSPFAQNFPPDISSGRYIVGLVADNGYGMPPEDMERLFSRFYRGWATQTSISGTGLGLFIVREILQLYGGDIAVISQIGLGTTFCFWLLALEL